MDKLDEIREIIKETQIIQKESTKEMRKLEKLFQGQWGKLMESLVEGDLVNLLKKWKITVDYTYTRVKGKYDNKDYEIDIIARNSIEVVAVEVKTTLIPDDVNYFLEKLKVIKEVFKDFKDMKLYGAVAFLRVESEANIYAERKGLFVIQATGSSASKRNDKNFKPEIF